MNDDATVEEIALEVMAQEEIERVSEAVCGPAMAAETIEATDSLFQAEKGLRALSDRAADLRIEIALAVNDLLAERLKKDEKEM